MNIKTQHLKFKAIKLKQDKHKLKFDKLDMLNAKKIKVGGK